MTDRSQPSEHFEDEEAGVGYAPPTLDLLAAFFLCGLALLTMIASVALPVPGDVLTAPGLLPFLVGASLLLMALGLGVAAIKRRKAGITDAAFSGRDHSTDLRALALAVAVAVYIAALEFLAFRHDVVFGEMRHSISAFEPITVVILAVIIQMSWRGALWITVAISLLWTAILSAVFQHIFKIPLPGTF